MRVRAGKADEKKWKKDLAKRARYGGRAERKTQEEKEDVKVDEGKA